MVPLAAVEVQEAKEEAEKAPEPLNPQGKKRGNYTTVTPMQKVLFWQIKKDKNMSVRENG